MLTTQVKTHILELTKEREIPITQEQYRTIKNMQKIDKYNDPLEIRDPDTGKILHDGLMKDILGFHEIQREDTTGMKWVCDFATRHGIRETECNCGEKYGMFGIEFRTRLNELYPSKYSSTITEEEKQKILKSFS